MKKVPSSSRLTVFGIRVVHHDDFPRSPVPMSLTPQVLETLRNSVCRFHPETGAKGFGPINRMGVDVLEIDESSLSRNLGAVYTPDKQWGDDRIRHWLSADSDEKRLWTMDVHSHPNGLGYPSPKVGQALGDLGYVEAVFEENEIMQYFYIPIITEAGPKARSVELHPWVVCRDDPHQPLCADVVIDRPDNFPPRIFNPQWEQGLAASSEPRPPEADGYARPDRGEASSPGQDPRALEPSAASTAEPHDRLHR